MVKSDRWIKEMAIKYKMIEPFYDHLVNVKDGSPCISFGLGSYGYDVRIADEFKVFTDVFSQVIDPKQMKDKAFIAVRGDTCLMPPHSFVLGRTVEHFDIPPDVLCLCVGKSTYARCGLAVNITPLEPEWRGYITLEISNTTPLPAILYANEGIAQVLFFQGDEFCEVTYADRKGKYQDQTGVVPARV